MTSFDSWNAELYHHGILGMKWGVRRFQNKDGSLTPAGEKRYENGDKPITSNSGTVRPKKKRLSEMTDDELRKSISRLKLEQQYKNLKHGSGMKSIEKGAGIVAKFMEFSERRRQAASEKEERFLRNKELNIREKEIKARIEEARQRTKQSEYDAKRAEQVAKQNEQIAEKEKAISARYKTRAGRMEKKAEYVKAKGDTKGIGIGRKKLSLVKKMFKKDSDKFAAAINSYFGVKSENVYKQVNVVSEPPELMNTNSGGKRQKGK